MRPRSSLAVLVVLAVAGCGNDRPDEASWADGWRSAQRLVPTADEFEAGGQELCDALTGQMREQLAGLTPTPSDALDDAVGSWVEHAEGIAFDCPGGAELTERLGELAVLAAEIDSGLRTPP